MLELSFDQSDSDCRMLLRHDPPGIEEVQMDFDDPDYDAKFEFDAPRYYDFQAINEGTPGDKWFDTAPDGPGCKADKSAGVVSREPLKPIQQDSAADRPQDDDRKKSSNIVTSWGQGAGKKVTRSNAQSSSAPGTELPSTSAALPSSTAAGVGPSAGMQPVTEPAAEAPAAEGVPAAAAAEAIPSRRLTRKSLGVGARRVCSSAADGARTEPPVTRSMSRIGHQLCSPVPEGKPHCRASPPMTRSRKCVTAVKAKPTSARTKPVPLDKVRHVLEAKVIKPARSTKPLTLPDDFELETDKRLAAKAAATNKEGADVRDEVSKSPYKSLAEKVRDFQSKTPVRFKSKPLKLAAAHHQQPSITDAKSPLLMTSRRARPSLMKSRQQLDEEEMERLRNEQFKAKPLDVRVLTSSGQLGVPKVDKPKPTEPRPFHLRSDSRAKARQSHEHPSMEQAAAAANFRAQPLNRSILDGPTFRPQKERVEVTVPKSPLLRTKLRSVLAAKADEPRKVRPSSAPKERSHSGSRDRPLSGNSTGSSRGLTAAAAAACGGRLQPTEPKPFQLQTEARGALHQDELAAKLAAEAARAKRLRRVTARPLPVTVDVRLVPPRPEPKPLTLPQPFELKSLARHETFEEQRKRKMQEEEEEARRAAEFKAHPMHVGAPFTVHESDAPLTVPEDLHLATEDRAVERHVFDAQVAEKIRQEEEQKRRREELKRKQEEEATREYRKKLRFSARPMPNFEQPYFAMPSDKPLTNPKTPNFASKKLKKAP